MKLGFIGLDDIAMNLVSNLLDAGRPISVFDSNEKAVEKMAGKGANPTYSLAEFVLSLSKPRTIWMMLPSKELDSVLKKLSPLLYEGDIVIDASNSYYKDSQARAKQFKSRGISFLDVGVAGGLDSARQGACISVGGDKNAFKKIESLFDDASAENGYAYVGKSGAGHFVKMIHNGIAYGMMGAIGEGLEALDKHKKEFGFDVKQVAGIFQHGSLIESRMMNWLNNSLAKGEFKSISGNVPKGTTEDEMEKLEKLANMPILKASRIARVKSRKKASFSGKVVSAIRHEFGGHSVKRSK